MTAASVATENTARANHQVAKQKYQVETMMNSANTYERKTIQDEMMDGVAVDQIRAMERDAAYQRKIIDGAVAYQEKIVNGGYQQGRLGQGPQGKVIEGATSKLYQGRKVEGYLGTMAEDYKRNRKLPPRVEEMLREQVNLDETVLHDVFAVAMEDLTLEKEANFVAKGLCHLCGAKEKYYVPVVSFCPHADENHSLCREHLRTIYRVRMEALFVGRNGTAPNRHLLRCIVCTLACPCTLCRAEKERNVRKYKCYLLDTLRRSGQGPTIAMRDDSATAAVASSMPEGGQLAHSAAQSSSESRRYARCPPTHPVHGHPPVQSDGFLARDTETVAAHEGRGLVQTQQPEYKQYLGSSRNDYGSSAQIPWTHSSSMQISSIQAFSATYSMQASSTEASKLLTSSTHASSMQAQSKQSSQYPPVPKQAAKDTPPDFLPVMSNGAPVIGSRAAARATSPRVHHGSTKLPSAATILNCAESEKSLVHLVSSLNQGGAPGSLVTSDARGQISKGSTYDQSKLRYNKSDIGSSGSGQGCNDAEMEAATMVYSVRGVADRRRQAESPHQDHLYTSSMDSSDSSPRERSNFAGRSIEDSHILKRKSNEGKDEASSGPRDLNTMAPRNDSEASRCGESVPSEQQNGDLRHHQTAMRLNLKTHGRGKECAHKADTNNENQSSQTPTSLPPARPGRSRKVTVGTVVTASSASRAGRKGTQERKTIAPPKRGRGRPPKRAKRSQNEDEKMADEKSIGDDEKEDEEEGGLVSELDANLDYCEVCQGAGDLVCCDKCPRSFHLKCLHMTENDLPEGDWQCNECKKPSRFDAYSVAVASEKTLLDKCLKIVQCLKSHPFAKQFLLPVENVPMYTRVVKQPMDLSKIENKLKMGAYIVDSNTVADGVNELDSTHFANDVRLMWSNCKLFNDDGSGIVRAADILSDGFERLYKESIARPLTSQNGC
ncbi:unnamed protein product [Peronospora belbahrii]|uniref:PHD-type domain-containing protein n=1 Tax=Peronospora belbahrii TaxID=622444 RepID=A0ABN8D5C1_9STRA|nr:unnamed protein product [Peronospora belbahrii]